MLQRIAAIVVTVASLPWLAHAGTGAQIPGRKPVPFEVKRKHIVGSRPILIGDLAPISDADSEALLRNAEGSARMLQKCVDVAGDVVRFAPGGRSLELQPSWDFESTTHILTAYCDDGIVFLGGSRQPDDGETRSWLFYWTKAPKTSWGPASIMPRTGRTTLTALRAIDPVSGQVLFASVGTDGRETLLSAPFAINQRP